MLLNNWVDNQPLINGSLIVWYYNENGEVCFYIY